MRFIQKDLAEKSMLKKSGFTEYFIRTNALEGNEFKAWIFRPGMQFLSTDKWWGDCGNRISEHEGLDFCLYEDRQGNIQKITEKTKVPAMYPGRVKGLIEDFLGESVVLAHEIFRDGKYQLCTLYAHTQRRPGIGINEAIDEGDVIATVADTAGSKSGIAPHLHISAAWMDRGISYEDLDWQTMGRRPDIFLIDPLTLIRTD